jgi:endonuclease III
MRGATESAKKVKKAFTALKNSLGKIPRSTPTDPITQLLLGIFSRNLPEAKAKEIVDQLRSMVVDYNELRVIPVGELAEAIELRTPDLWRKCEDVSRALNVIFAIEHAVSLDRVKTLPRKDAKAYLDRIPGLEAYTRARIRLLGFEWHAIPLDEAMWAWCIREELVDPKATLEEAQAFLERQIDEADAPDFVALVRKQAWAECAALVRKGQAPRIESAAPDRKSTNMLQAIAGGAAIDEPDLDLELEDELVEAPAPSAKKKGAKAAAAEKPAKAKAKKSASSAKAAAPAKSAKRVAAAAPAKASRAKSGKAARSESGGSD